MMLKSTKEVCVSYLIFLWMTSIQFAASAGGECKVMIRDKDVTKDLLVDNDMVEYPHVDCSGALRCEGAIITDCPKVICNGTEACNEAQIIDFSREVICMKAHACHFTQIHALESSGSSNRRRELTATSTSTTTKNIQQNDKNSHRRMAGRDDDNFVQNVKCEGSGACADANIVAPSVVCLGSKGCRKTQIAADTVKCHYGGQRYPACTQKTAIRVSQCLYCGIRGCDGKAVNKCRYRAIDHWYEDIDVTTEKYNSFAVCTSESLLGPSCPEEWENQLHYELHGEDPNEEEEGSF